MADEEFKDYGRTSHISVLMYLKDEFELSSQEIARLLVKHRQVLLNGIRTRDKTVDTGDRIMEKEPAL